MLFERPSSKSSEFSRLAHLEPLIEIESSRLKKLLIFSTTFASYLCISACKPKVLSFAEIVKQVKSFKKIIKRNKIGASNRNQLKGVHGPCQSTPIVAKKITFSKVHEMLYNKCGRDYQPVKNGPC